MACVSWQCRTRQKARKDRCPRCTAARLVQSQLRGYGSEDGLEGWFLYPPRCSRTGLAGWISLEKVAVVVAVRLRVFDARQLRRKHRQRQEEGVANVLIKALKRKDARHVLAVLGLLAGRTGLDAGRRTRCVHVWTLRGIA